VTMAEYLTLSVGWNKVSRSYYILQSTEKNVLWLNISR